MSAGAPISFRCPNCAAALRAPLELAGRRGACFRCGRRVTVPAPDPAAIPLAAAGDEAYDVWRGDGLAPESQRTFIRVTCRICESHLSVDCDQLGRQVRCPDCGAVNTAVPRREFPDERQPAADDEGYEIWDEASEPPLSLSSAAGDYFAFACPVCDARLYAGRGDVGEETYCPDCYKRFPVPTPPRAKMQSALVEEGASYQTDGAGERDDAGRRQGRATMRLARQRVREVPDARQLLPKRPFISGVFTFPFYPSSGLAWLNLTLSGALVLGLLFWALRLGATPLAGGIAAAPPLVGAILFTVVSSIAVGGWLIAAAAAAVSIVRDTSQGLRDVHEWPEAGWMEWVDDALKLYVPILFCSLPGWTVAVTLHLDGVWTAAAVGVSIAALLPVALLSSLERNSSVAVLSPVVLRAMTKCPFAWLRYYWMCLLIVAPAGVAGIFIHSSSSMLLRCVLGSMLITTWLFLYFRLLGRLACYLAEKMPAVDDDASPLDSPAEEEP